MQGLSAVAAFQLQVELGIPAALEIILGSHGHVQLAYELLLNMYHIHVPQPDLVGHLQGMRERKAHMRKKKKKKKRKAHKRKSS